MDTGGWFLSKNGADWFHEDSGASSSNPNPSSCTMPTTWIPHYDAQEEMNLPIPNYYSQSQGDDLMINNYSYELEAAAEFSSNSAAAWQCSPEIGMERMTDPFGGAASAGDEEERRDVGSCAYYCPSKSHSQAEKRRRDRINAQLASLRKLIPQSDKMDKAALLRNTVDQVKQLRTQANEIDEALITVPSELDEVKVEELLCGLNNQLMIQATLCCEDRPELLTELESTLKGLKLMVVRADISSLSGRLKIILVLSSTSGDCSVSIKHPLRAALHRLICFSNSNPNSSYRFTSRRQRLLFPS